MRRRFYVERFESNSATLHGESAEHLGRVLRAESGQLYELSDGRSVWLGRVERVELSKRGESRIEFALVEPVAAPKERLHIALLIAVVKFDRFEWCLEKAAELGASEIVPLAATRTDKPLIAAAAKRRARWERILLESSQQCRRLHPPVLRMSAAGAADHARTGALAHPEAAFAGCAADARIILSERRGAAPVRGVLQEISSRLAPADVITAALAIGPEGGWTDEEFAASGASGFAEASLGENILRTETAVLASMAVLNFALG